MDENMTNKEEVVFSEHHVMAVSLKNMWTKMASTYQCINVELTEKLLTVKPIMLIGWAIFILGLDLYHKIPVSQIRCIEEKGKWMSYGKLEITFVNAKGEQRGIILYLKKYLEFISKVKPMIE